MFDAFTTPCISRLFAFSAFGLSLLHIFGFVDELAIFYSSRLIFEKHEFRRLFTSIFFFGELNCMLFLDIFFFTLNAHQIEKTQFAGRPLDFLFFAVFGWSCLWVYASYIPTAFLGVGFSCYVSYYWSKVFPNEMFQMIGAPIPIRADVVPLLFLLMEVQRGRRYVLFTLFCDLSAHAYYFLADVLRQRYSLKLMMLPESFNTAFARILV
jgi:Derlin-2/3